MKVHAFGLCLLLSALAGFANQAAAQPAKDSDGELAKKIQRLRDQLDSLIQEQKDRSDKFLEQQRIEAERRAREETERRAKEEAAKRKAEDERQAKETAESKKHIAKVEIRGLLGKGPETVGFGYVQAWHVTIDDMKWRLDFGDKKEFAEQAVKLAGTPVAISGTAAYAKKTQVNPYLIPPALPQPMPLPGLPQPPQAIYFPTPIVINVESLKAAKD